MVLVEAIKQLMDPEPPPEARRSGSMQADPGSGEGMAPSELEDFLVGAEDAFVEVHDE